MRGIGFKLDDDEKIVQEVQKVAHENGERLDKDVQTLHGSVRCHRKESLGAKGYLTGRYIEITLRFFKQCVQQVSGRYMLITFKKYPSR